MSPDTQFRVALVDVADRHIVASCLAADGTAADVMAHAFLALGSSQAGDTEVVTRVVLHPHRLEEI